MKALLATTALAVVVSRDGGVVVMRKSERSLYRARIPTTDIAADGAAIRNTPWKGGVNPGKRSLMNLVTCPDAGRVTTAGVAATVPSKRLSWRLTVTVAAVGLAIAIPV